MKNLKFMGVDWLVSERTRLKQRLGNLRKLAIAGYDVEQMLEQTMAAMDELQAEIDRRAEQLHS